MSVVLGILVTVALLTAAGRGLLRLLRAETDRLPVPVIAALWFLAGVVANAFVVTMLAVLGLPVRQWPLAGPLLLVLAVLGQRTAPRSTRPPAPPRSWALPSLAAVLAIPVVVIAAMEKITVNDEYAIWALKARALYKIGHLDTFLFSGDPTYKFSHFDYPLLVPALQLSTDSWMGHESDAAAHFMVALVGAAGFVLIVGLVQRLVGARAAAVALITLPATRGLLKQSTWLLADVTTAVLALSLVLMLTLALTGARERMRGWLLLAAPMAAGAAMTKNEGAAFVVAALIGALVAFPRGQRRWVAIPAGAGLLGLLPWSLWSRSHGVTSEFITTSTLKPSVLAHQWHRIGTLLSTLARYWPGPSGWFLLVLLAVAVAVAIRLPLARRPIILIVTAGVVSVAALLLTYLVAPEFSGPFLRSNMSRVTLLPGMLAWVGAALLGGFLLDRPHAVRAERAPAKPPPELADAS